MSLVEESSGRGAGRPGETADGSADETAVEEVPGELAPEVVGPRKPPLEQIGPQRAPLPRRGRRRDQVQSSSRTDSGSASGSAEIDEQRLGFAFVHADRRPSQLRESNGKDDIGARVVHVPAGAIALCRFAGDEATELESAVEVVQGGDSAPAARCRGPARRGRGTGASATDASATMSAIATRAVRPFMATVSAGEGRGKRP